MTMNPVEPLLGTDQAHVIAVVSTSLHITTPSAANSTLVTPTSSVAVATTVIVRPLRIDVPSTGDEIWTTGATVSSSTLGSTATTAGVDTLVR